MRPVATVFNLAFDEIESSKRALPDFFQQRFVSQRGYCDPHAYTVRVGFQRTLFVQLENLALVPTKLEEPFDAALKHSAPRFWLAAQ